MTVDGQPVQIAGTGFADGFEEITSPFIAPILYLTGENFINLETNAGGAGSIFDTFQILPPAPPVAQPFNIVAIERGQFNAITLTFESNLGDSFNVERATDLTDFVTITANPIAGQAGTTQFEDEDVPPDAVRVFYRVVRD